MASVTSRPPPIFATQGYELVLPHSPSHKSNKRRQRKRQTYVKVALLVAVLLTTSVASAAMTVLVLRGTSSNLIANQPVTGTAALSCSDGDDLSPTKDSFNASADPLDRLLDSLVFDIRLKRIVQLADTARAALSTAANASKPTGALNPLVRRLHDPRLQIARLNKSDEFAPWPLDSAYLDEMAGDFTLIADILQPLVAKVPFDDGALRRAMTALSTASCIVRRIQRDLRASATRDPTRPTPTNRAGLDAASRRPPTPSDAKLLRRAEVHLHVVCRDAAAIIRSHTSLCSAFVALDARLTLQNAIQARAADDVI